ncbi:hypothetical protein EYF80_061451 [Liparis tanakae]|uniref:Uncharacterized protein n=1 Tax=Liparis tanakae TaxID=230148 RepID=A0A4Z2EJ85_9TELE|nr:hypothetical protein EYF80_061451 [Liparis tanakae]
MCRRGQLERLPQETVKLGLHQHAAGVRHLRKHIYRHTDTSRSLSTSFPPHSVASIAFTESTLYLSMAASKKSTSRAALSRGSMVCVVGSRLLSWLNRADTKFSSLVTEMPAFSSTAFSPASRTASITL